MIRVGLCAAWWRRSIVTSAIAGGGLAGALIALALAARAARSFACCWSRKATRSAATMSRSFFHSDVADEDRWLLAPLVCHGWRGYNIAFPQRRRRLGTPYYSILSERLDEVRARARSATISS